MTQFINGWTLDKFMKQIEKKNGWVKCTEFGDSCLYRDGEDKACMVGAFIPDDKYVGAMEHTGAIEVIRAFNLQNYMPLCAQDMERLQTHHDQFEETHDGDDFKSYMLEYFNAVGIK